MLHSNDKSGHRIGFKCISLKSYFSHDLTIQSQ